MTGKGIIWLGWERHIRSKFHTSGTALFLPLESQAVLNNRSPKMQDAEADCIINTCVFQMWSTLSTGNWVAYLMHQSPSISWSRRKCKAPLGTWEYLVPTEWKSCSLFKFSTSLKVWKGCYWPRMQPALCKAVVWSTFVQEMPHFGEENKSLS